MRTEREKYEKSFENMEQLNNRIGQQAYLGNIDHCTDVIDIINSLTPQDIYNTVHKYYDTDKASIAVVHPETTVEKINRLQRCYINQRNGFMTSDMQ